MYHEIQKAKSEESSMKKSYVKSVPSMLVASAILLFLLASCGSSNSDISPDTSSGQTTVFPHESDTNEINPAESEAAQTIEHTTNVVCPEFSLTGGFIIPVEQQTEVPDGFIEISSEKDFTKIGLNPNGYYILTNDLDLAGVEYEPIQNFSGVLDGNGHIITNYGHSLLFFSVKDGGEIKNLGVTYSSEFPFPTYKFKKYDYTGASGIVGTLESAKIDNCFVSGDIEGTEGLLPGGVAGRLAGIVVIAESSEIINCYNKCNIKEGDAGIVYKSISTTISNCFNAGEIVSSRCVGGIANFTKISTEIRDCYNTGNLTGNGCAGIVSYPCDINFLSRCYNSGAITSRADDDRAYQHAAVGIVAVGCADGSIIQNCYNGGKILYNFNPNPDVPEMSPGAFGIGNSRHTVYVNCYNIGELITSGGETIGGICSDGENNLEYCYFSESAESATPQGALFANVEQLTDSEMQQESSFEGFDFDNTWRMGDVDYPYPVFLPAY